MKTVIKSVVDDGDFFEVQPYYAKNMITGFGQGGSGDITVNGRDIRSMSIRQLRDEGMVHVPEDRMAMGAAKDMSIRENLMADKISLPQYNKKFTLNDEAITMDTN